MYDVLKDAIYNEPRKSLHTNWVVWVGVFKRSDIEDNGEGASSEEEYMSI